MTCFSDINCDILDRVVYFATPGACSSLRKWKAALYLLSVSPVFRRVGFKRIYRNAFVVDLKAYNSKQAFKKIANYQANSDCLPTATNLNLIEMHGLEANVQRLIINGSGDIMYRSVLAHIIAMIPSFDQEHPEIEPLKSARLYVTDARCFSAMVALSAMFRQRFPNVHDLYIDTCTSHSFSLAMFATELVDAYASQLTHFNYCGIANFNAYAFPETITNLRLDLLKITNAGMALINPKLLQRLSLEFWSFPFSWSLFVDGDSGSVLFDKLEFLELIRKAFHTADSDWEWTKAHFPKLTELHVCCGKFTAEDVRWLLASPLKVLWLSGPCEPAIEFCQHDLSQLYSFSFTLSDTNIDISDFVSKTNYIFRRTCGINVVHSQLMSSNVLAFPQTILWPTVTNLTIDSGSGLANLLIVALVLPKLITLEVKFSANITPIGDNDYAFIREFEETVDEPTESKLEKLVIDLDGSECKEVFLAGLKRLKLYFPKLHIIHCAGVNVL